MIRGACFVLLLGASVAVAADVSRTVANNGNLIMEDVPEIPAEIIDSLNRYQNVRYASFRAWTEDGSGIYVSTRFGDVAQLHRVDMPGGARHQLTFYKEPLGGITSQPQGSDLLVTRDTGGNEFSQIFLLDPITGRETLLSDGESRNNAALWDRDGQHVSQGFQSFRRGLSRAIPDESPLAHRAVEEREDLGDDRLGGISASPPSVLGSACSHRRRAARKKPLQQVDSVHHDGNNH